MTAETIKVHVLFLNQRCHSFSKPTVQLPYFSE